MKDGTTALYAASESGKTDCLRLLLTHGASPNILRQDNTSPLHIAAREGHIECLELLLQQNGQVDQVDLLGCTPLYWAAANGQVESCKLLLDHDAQLDIATKTNWTPVHSAIHSGQLECLKLFVSYHKSCQQESKSESYQNSLLNVVNMADMEGWTVAHLAAIRNTKDYLQVLLEINEVDLERRDKLNRTVTDVASKECLDYLGSIDGKNERTCTVSIELLGSDSNTHNPDTAPLKASEAIIDMGVIKVTSETEWSKLEEMLGDLLTTHFNQVAVGLKTKKTSKLDQDPTEPSQQYTLGLSLNSVKFYAIGLYHWSPGTPSDMTPFDILCNNETRQINVGLFDFEDGCLDAIAYETLIPVHTLQNYLRLVEQYKNVVFYGPGGCGKICVARKLALCVQSKELQAGNTCQISFVSFDEKFSRKNFMKVLIEKGCLLPRTTIAQPGHITILVMDNLSKISMSDVFGDVLVAIENRGPMNHVIVQLEDTRVPQTYYLHSNCYFIGTMDRSRSTGLELPIQQRFRWVHFRNDAEPIKTLLHRYLFRKLLHCQGGKPAIPEDPVFKAVEWIVCVWQRLNEGLIKLGLPDLAFGPSHFLSCPINLHKPNSILRWLCLLWNHAIAPVVSEAVIKGSGTDAGSEGQKKVANTALYVLMQRAVVSGCPLSGQEKERYLASFLGSNELDIKMRSDKKESAGGQGVNPTSPSSDTPDVTLQQIAETSQKLQESNITANESQVSYESQRNITKQKEADSLENIYQQFDAEHSGLHIDNGKERVSQKNKIGVKSENSINEEKISQSKSTSTKKAKIREKAKGGIGSKSRSKSKSPIRGDLAAEIESHNEDVNTTSEKSQQSQIVTSEAAEPSIDVKTEVKSATTEHMGMFDEPGLLVALSGSKKVTPSQASLADAEIQLKRIETLKADMRRALNPRPESPRSGAMQRAFTPPLYADANARAAGAFSPNPDSVKRSDSFGASVEFHSRNFKFKTPGLDFKKIGSYTSGSLSNSGSGSPQSPTWKTYPGRKDNPYQ